MLNARDSPSKELAKTWTISVELLANSRMFISQSLPDVPGKNVDLYQKDNGQSVKMTVTCI